MQSANRNAALRHFRFAANMLPQDFGGEKVLSQRPNVSASYNRARC
jgi:hypothetical protein